MPVNCEHWLITTTLSSASATNARSWAYVDRRSTTALHRYGNRRYGSWPRSIPTARFGKLPLPGGDFGSLFLDYFGGSFPTALTRSAVWKPWRWRSGVAGSQRLPTPIKIASSQHLCLWLGCRIKRSGSAGQERNVATTTSSDQRLLPQPAEHRQDFRRGRVQSWPNERASTEISKASEPTLTNSSAR